ncbi:unnamed protein product [Cuscuta epithymum]|uniref:Late embryogenesis abundant protein LEA-2 subgroup domain-containing protein n=1 Tax=Cuscuta epithymum TaxID=186058 RepID=A0AAV0DDY0_9ASTE|nr:unnamed protein product [Cuscuta epithymum]CAH9124227.1 unnamed protein product [Cuscuta epithymum]
MNINVNSEEGELERNARRSFRRMCCYMMAAFFCLLALAVILISIYYIKNPIPKAPAYSVVDARPLSTNRSSRFTGGGKVTFILNTRNRNKRKYTNDYGTTQSSLYLGGAGALEQVANATAVAFLQPPRASNNVTLTFPVPAAVLHDGSTAVIKMNAQLRFRDKSNYGQVQVTCKLSYSSRLPRGFDVPNKCAVHYFWPLNCGWTNRWGNGICQQRY